MTPAAHALHTPSIDPATTPQAVEPIPNTPATGTVTLDNMQPVVGEPVTATADVSDANGINAASFRSEWQLEVTPGRWLPLASGDTYTPIEADLDHRLRVVIFFRDRLGNRESIASDPTEPVTLPGPIVTEPLLVLTIPKAVIHPTVGVQATLTGIIAGLEQPIAGADVTFTVDGQILHATTNARGVASTSFTLTAPSDTLLEFTASAVLPSDPRGPRVIADVVTRSAAYPTITWLPAEPTPEGGPGAVTTMSNLVVLDRPAPAPVTIHWSTSNGSAVDGVDYIASSGSIVIPTGQQTAFINVDVIGDDTVEPDETIVVSATSTDAVVAEALTLDWVILNDDTATLSFGTAPRLTEAGADGNHDLVFALRLDHPSSAAVTVDWSTQADTAGAADVQITSGTVVFAPGVKNATVRITVTDDTLIEFDETVVFSVDAIDGAAAPAVPTQAGTIVNDDLATISMGLGPLVIEGNTGAQQQLGFSVSVDRPSPWPITVRWQAAGGTATFTKDYAVDRGSIVIPAGATTATLSVGVIGEATVEVDETVIVRLTSATGAISPTDVQAEGVIVDDDAPITATILNTTQSEGNEGTTDFAFTVVFSRTTTSPLTFRVTTAAGTAKAVTDFTTLSNQLVRVPAGARTFTFFVKVVGDRVREGREAFKVSVKSPVGFTIKTPTATGTILNDD